MVNEKTDRKLEVGMDLLRKSPRPASEMSHFRSPFFLYWVTMKEIAKHRDKIDELDERILDLIQERVNEAISIRRLKIEHDIPLVTPEREEELIQRLVDRSGGQLPADVIKTIWESIIEGGKQIKDN